MMAAAPGIPEDTDLSRHVILVDRDGHPLHPTERSGVLGESEYSAYLDRLFESVRGSGKEKILLFIHGGLTSPDTALGHAREWTPSMKADGFCPLFINWNAGFLTNYAEYLFRIRRGEVVRGAWGALTGPFYLLADLGRGLSRAPISWADQAVMLSATLEAYRKRSDARSLDVPSSIGRDRRSPWQFLLRGILLLISTLGALLILGQIARALAFPHWAGPASLLETLVVTRGPWPARLAALLLYVYGSKVLTLPLLVGIGRSTWEAMLRRLQTVIRRPQEFRAQSPPGFLAPTGALAVFLERLSSYASRSPSTPITLIGHSMGTIVANEILRCVPSVPYQDIVYLAAACSVDDFHDAFLSYRESRPKGAPLPQWFGLSLHPIAEREEWNALDIAPRGSILEWIDDLYTNPRTILDRTLGRWDNISRTLQVFEPSLRASMHLKSFSVGSDPEYPDYNPQKHTEFIEGAFWREDHWQPKGGPG
jgi:hypothetical protein